MSLFKTVPSSDGDNGPGDVRPVALLALVSLVCSLASPAPSFLTSRVNDLGALTFAEAAPMPSGTSDPCPGGNMPTESSLGTEGAE